MFTLRVIIRRILAFVYDMSVENTTQGYAHCGTKRYRTTWPTSTYCPDCHIHIKVMKPRSLT